MAFVTAFIDSYCNQKEPPILFKKNKKKYAYDLYKMSIF